MEVIKVYEIKTRSLKVSDGTNLRWKRLPFTLISLSSFYLKCLGIHENVQGTKQNYQDIIVPDFKNTQLSKLTPLSRHKQQNLQLWAFSQPDTTMVVIKFPSACGVVVNTCRRSSSKRNSKPDKGNLE